MLQSLSQSIFYWYLSTFAVFLSKALRQCISDALGMPEEQAVADRDQTIRPMPLLKSIPIITAI
jgi:hypothetical protein